MPTDTEKGKRMKPSEAIENIEYARRWMGCESDFSEEALDMAIFALDKQIPQKPEMIWDTTFGKIRPHCLVCGASNPTGANYCWNCGQRFISEEES